MKIHNKAAVIVPFCDDTQQTKDNKAAVIVTFAMTHENTHKAAEKIVPFYDDIHLTIYNKAAANHRILTIKTIKNSIHINVDILHNENIFFFQNG